MIHEAPLKRENNTFRITTPRVLRMLSKLFFFAMGESRAITF